MAHQPQEKVGAVEELSKPKSKIEPEKWHFICTNCEQRLRFAARKPIDFVCPSCKREYSVTDKGEVFADIKPRAVVPRTMLDDLCINAPLTRPISGKGFIGKITSLLGDTIEAASDANDSAHGKRLRSELIDTFHKMNSLHPTISNAALQGFVKKSSSMIGEIPNWSFDGRLKMGRELQRQARLEFDFNQAESYALWLTGAWLESRCRRTEDAEFVRLALEDFLRKHI